MVGERAGDRGLHALTVVRVDTLEIALERDAELPGLEPVDPVELVTPRDLVAAHVPLPAAHVGDRLGLFEPPPAAPQLHLAATEGCLGLLAFADVVQERVERDA